MTMSAIPSIGVIVLAISMAKSHDDIAKAMRFVDVSTHLFPDEKSQIRRLLSEKKAELQRISDMVFLNFETALTEKAESPPSVRKVA